MILFPFFKAGYKIYQCYKEDINIPIPSTSAKPRKTRMKDRLVRIYILTSDSPKTKQQWCFHANDGGGSPTSKKLLKFCKCNDHWLSQNFVGFTSKFFLVIVELRLIKICNFLFLWYGYGC